jgi:hypothetical protein
LGKFDSREKGVIGGEMPEWSEWLRRSFVAMNNERAIINLTNVHDLRSGTQMDVEGA